MNKEENTTVTISPPEGMGESVTMIIKQEFINDQRLDILQKACEIAWQSFVKENKWNILENG